MIATSLQLFFLQVLAVVDIVVAILLAISALNSYIRFLPLMYRVGLFACATGIFFQGATTFYYVIAAHHFHPELMPYWLGIDNLKDIGIIIIAMWYFYDSRKYIKRKSNGYQSKNRS